MNSRISEVSHLMLGLSRLRSLFDCFFNQWSNHLNLPIAFYRFTFFISAFLEIRAGRIFYLLLLDFNMVWLEWDHKSTWLRVKNHVIFEWLHPTFQANFVPQNVFERFWFNFWKIASSGIPYFIELFKIFAVNKDPLRTELEF